MTQSGNERPRNLDQKSALGRPRHEKIPRGLVGGDDMVWRCVFDEVGDGSCDDRTTSPHSGGLEGDVVGMGDGGAISNEERVVDQLVWTPERALYLAGRPPPSSGLGRGALLLKLLLHTQCYTIGRLSPDVGSWVVAHDKVLIKVLIINKYVPFGGP